MCQIQDGCHTTCPFSTSERKKLLNDTSVKACFVIRNTFQKLFIHFVLVWGKVNTRWLPPPIFQRLGIFIIINYDPTNLNEILY